VVRARALNRASYMSDFWLKSLNERRAREGKPPLAAIPEFGCVQCGQVSPIANHLYQSSLGDLRTCRICLFSRRPFSTLDLRNGEAVEWYFDGTEGHRPEDYAVVLTNRAFYAFFSYWWIAAWWRRFSRDDIQDASFHDARRMPALHVKLTTRTVVLRAPPDDASETESNRRALREMAERLHGLAGNRPGTV